MMNVLNYAAACEKMFEENLLNMSGYERKTTFFSDLSIAEVFGKNEILDTHKRVVEEWLDNIEYITEYAICLNHKIWQHYEKDAHEQAMLYDKLWKEMDAKIIEHYNGNKEAMGWNTIIELPTNINNILWWGNLLHYRT